MVRARGEATDAIPVTVLLDTNVLLDVILDRTPWADDATTLLDRIARHEARGYVAAHAVTTVYYLVERAKGRAATTTAGPDLLDILAVAAPEGADFRPALALGLKD